MNTNTIFFSYSRDNSEFVLALAKELRESGAKVWLDQLDITPGSRWDKSIETALQEAGTLIVVLSKASVASHNVMDEVSYALEEGKTVVPVLYEACEIPFRLRRLQFADFTTSHEAGMATLRSALKNDGPVTKKEVGLPPPPETTTKVDSVSPAKQSNQNSVISKAPKHSAKSKKPILYAVIALVAIVAIYGIYAAMTAGGKDMMALCKADWQELEASMEEDKEINELAALRKHIELYAPCPHENEAMDRISFLKALGSESDNSITTIEQDAIGETVNTKLNNTEIKTSATTKQSETNNGNQNQPSKTQEKEELTGLTVKRVDYDTGSFSQTSDRLWIERNTEGERRFTLIKRDKNTVVLGDGPDVRITLDLENAAILYSDANVEPVTLYYITSTSETSN